MRVCFLASPRSVGERPDFFVKVFSHLAKDNKMTDALVKRLAGMKIEDFYKVKGKERVSRFKEWIINIKKCDVLVVEVSGHSMTLGYVIGKALELNKPVVVLYEKNKKSFFVSGIVSSKLQMLEYNEDNVSEVVDKALEKAKGLIDVRFNFFVNPGILTYLDWVAMKKKVPRSVFLRELIEKQMKKDKEFKG